MTDKAKLITSWLLILLAIISTLLWDLAIFISLVIACIIIRKDDIVKSDNVNKKTYLVATYLSIIAIGLWFISFWAPFSHIDTDMLFRIFIIVLLLPLAPRFIIHDYKKLKTVFTELQ